MFVEKKVRLSISKEDYKLMEYHYNKYRATKDGYHLKEYQKLDDKYCRTIKVPLSGNGNLLQQLNNAIDILDKIR